MVFIFSWVLSWHEVPNFLTAAAIVKRQRAKERNQYLNLKQPESSMRGARINWFVYVFGLSKAPSLKKREDILSKQLIRNHTASSS